MTKRTHKVARVLAGAVLAGATLSLTACAAAAARIDRADQMKERFDAADTDHDGYISRDEAGKGLPRIAAHFDDADANRDGKLSKDEIADYLRSQRKSR
jgi:Ca2+-binding EF-hand superfamily protein